MRNTVLPQRDQSFNDTANLDNAVLVSRSTKAQGGTTWSAPITLRRDTSPTVFNDKESLTADQNPGTNGRRYVYAIWDRLVFPSERSRGVSFLTTAAFRGPTWFARSTNDGATWEPAHPIYDSGQNDQTIGNQIVALGNTDLVNVFNEINNDNSGGGRGARVRVLRSEDRGSSWSAPTTVSRLGTVEVTDPETGDPVRTGDIIPEIASDERAGHDEVSPSGRTPDSGSSATRSHSPARPTAAERGRRRCASASTTTRRRSRRPSGWTPTATSV